MSGGVRAGRVPQPLELESGGREDGLEYDPAWPVFSGIDLSLDADLAAHRRAGGTLAAVRDFSARSPRRAALLAGLAALLIAAAFVSGRGSVAQRACATSDNADGDVADTVAPEGAVSSSFEARHDYRGRPRAVDAARGAVAADHGRCSDLGVEVLREGGSAADAAVAAALCQGVLNPMASGLGGGLIVLVRLPNGTAEAVIARETAPAAANETMFVGAPARAIAGGLAVAVPLELRGLHLLHERHGRLPWRRLVEPAAALAADGFPAHPYLVGVLGGGEGGSPWAELLEVPGLRDAFFVRDGGAWRAPRVNETCCRRPALAALLRAVAERGPDALYVERGAALAADIAAAGGVVTAADLAAARALVRPALSARVWGAEVLVPPPPSSGAALLAGLGVLAGYEEPLAGAGALGAHRLVEAAKHAFALRGWLGDPGPDAAAGWVPRLDEVLADAASPAYAAGLRAATRDGGVLPLSAYGGRWSAPAGGGPPDDAGTTHLSAVDAGGMAVALTSTVNTGFGSKVVSASTGLILNNQMDDFSTPGQANVYGLPPARANFIRPGKRPLSSMTPTLVVSRGELRAALGASGGPRIVTALLQTLARVVAYGEDAAAAVTGARLHHQLAPAALFAEDWAAGGAAFRYDAGTLAALRGLGHAVRATDWGAVVQAVVAAPGGGLRAVSDARKDGAPAGY